MNKINLTELVTSTQDAQRGIRYPDIPCGDCYECCKLPVHLTDEEKRHLGTKALGKRSDGCCDQLGIDGKCMIYSIRPLACRKYDCRPDFLIKAMGGKSNVEPTSPHQVVIDGENLLLKLIITAKEIVEMLRQDTNLKVHVWEASCISYEKAFDNLMESVRS